MSRFFSRQLFFWGAVASFLFYWLALPPIHWSRAVFLAPMIWSLLISNDAFFEPRPFVRPEDFFHRIALRIFRLFFGGAYRQLWTSALLFWLAAIVWISYPHPGTVAGWIAASCVLACYFPLFVALTRSICRFVGAPIWTIAPIAWVAVEWIRNRAFGGFSFAGLSHTIYDQPQLIQIAELLGEYGVQALIVLVGFLLGEAIKRERSRAFGSVMPVCIVVCVLIAVWEFGAWRVSTYEKLENVAREEARPCLRLALLQDNITFSFPIPPEVNKQIYSRYMELTSQAAKDSRGYDAVVWPEGSFNDYYLDFDDDFTELLAYLNARDASSRNIDVLKTRYPRFFEGTEEEQEERRSELLRMSEELANRRRLWASLTKRWGFAAILGATTVTCGETGQYHSYNSAVLVPKFDDSVGYEELIQAPTSSIVAKGGGFRRYDKSQLVMFGEYIPFAEYLPKSWGLDAFCTKSGLGRGAGATAFELAPQGASESFILAPMICFESSIPQYIKSQTRELKAAGADPDVLLMISNDGWFRNGMQTDLHLATLVYRAIENRRSVASAAHGGFSAHIDPLGRVRSQGKRRNSEIVTAEIEKVRMNQLGVIQTKSGRTFDVAEIFAGLCALISFTIGLATFVEFWRGRTSRSASTSSPEKEGCGK